MQMQDVTQEKLQILTAEKTRSQFNPYVLKNNTNETHKNKLIYPELLALLVHSVKNHDLIFNPKQKSHMKTKRVANK